MKRLKINFTSVIALLLIALFLALTACSPAAEETFATPTVTIAQFVEVEVEEEATAQKPTSTATVMATEATSTATQAVPEATKTTSAEVADAKASPTAEVVEEEASPTVEVVEEEASTVEVVEEEASPTVEVVEEEASPTVEAAEEEASPTVEVVEEVASPTEVVEEVASTAEASDSNESEIVTETVPVATWNPLPTHTPDTAATVAPATVAPATVAPATVAPATSTAVISSPEVTATPDIAGEASDMADILNQIANPNNDETATPEGQQTQSYVDRVLAIAFDVPANWTMEGEPGAYGSVYAPEEQASLNFSVISEESNTLELALEEVKGGAFGPHISEAESVKLGQFDGLRLNLSPNEVEGGPSVIWLMMTPVRRAIRFIPQGDLTLIEPILNTVRGIR
jgi:hypothetical protein